MKFKHILFAGLVGLMGCGDDNEGDTSITIDRDEEEQQQEQEGPVTTGPTIKINNRIENNITFITRTRVINNDYNFNWQCTNAPDNVIHKQYIHISVRCPTFSDDTNFDGVVDQAEIEQVVGPRIYALDSNANSEEEETFPSTGSYTYNQSVPLSTLREFVPAGQDFVVMIYGAPTTTTLPASYSSTSDDPTHITVPIACKVFQAPAISGGTTGGTFGGTAGGTVGSTFGGTAGGTVAGGTTGGGTTGGTTTGTTIGGTGGSTIGGTVGSTVGGTAGGTTGGTAGGTTTGGAPL